MTGRRIPVTPMTRLKRGRQRGVFERQAIYDILDASPMCHVGHLVGGQSVVTPTCHWRDEDALYWHGSRLSRMVQSALAEPVCVTVTCLDGLVLARSAFHHSANFRSAMVFGQAQLVQDEDEKTHALKVFVERLFPGRWSQVRSPSRKEMAATSVLRLPIEEASAKVRNGPPNDAPADMDLNVWAGVVPVNTSLGKPESCAELADGVPTPRHARHFRF